MLMPKLILGLGQAALELCPSLLRLGVLVRRARKLGPRAFQALLGLQARLRLAGKLGPELGNRLLPAPAFLLERPLQL